MLANEAAGQTDLEMQSMLMSHQFSFSSVYSENLYWTYFEFGSILPEHGLIAAWDAVGQIETYFNVVPGTLHYIYMVQN